MSSPTDRSAGGPNGSAEGLQGSVETSDGDGRVATSAVASSQELAEFLLDLSIAIHHHGMYPPGHPSLEPAATGVTDRVTALLNKHGTLSLGVAKDQLVIEGVATDANNPVLRELAGRLHRHHLGAVSFHPGVSQQEIEELLILLSESDEAEEPLGLGPRERRERQPHIRMHPVAYDSLRLIDDDGRLEEDDETRSARTRCAQLWVGLARAAIMQEGREGRSSGEDRSGHSSDVPHDPVTVARAISEQAESDAYDQAVVGYFLQIADELHTASGADAVQLNQRMAQLVSAMEPEALTRLLKMGGDNGQRRRFLVNASQGLEPDSVLRLVEAACESEEQEVSDHMLRMLGKLSQHADGAGQGHALASLQEQVSELVTDWALADPNPDGYSIALSDMATNESLLVETEEERSTPEPRRMVDMALELDSAGDAVVRAVRQLIDSEDGPWLLERLADDPSSALTQSLMGSTEDLQELLRQVLNQETVDDSVLDTVLDLAGDRAAESMMDTLVASESRHIRRVLLDRLLTLQPQAGLLAIRHLEDPRWYVTRNMLRLLNAADEVPEEFLPDPYLEHEDHRVRYEAVRLCIGLGRDRDKAIACGLADPDEKTARLALNAAQESCPAAALPLVVSRASRGPSDVRVAAIQILAAAGGDTAVPTLLDFIRPRRGLFGMKHPPKDPVYLASLRALCPHADDERVRAALDLAIGREDPDIDEAVRAGSVANG